MLRKNYWKNRYKNKNTTWDIGYPSPAIITYAKQLTNKQLKILIPGCGNSYEAEYLHHNGFTNLYVLDIAKEPLQNFLKRCPTFPSKNLINEDFFTHNSTYDLILEQTFFCSLLPELRKKYVLKMHNLLKEKGKLAGLLFNKTFDKKGPPFGGDILQYKELFNTNFTIKSLKKCYNSIKPRQENELFFIFEKK